jgi:hypothetical protein
MYVRNATADRLFGATRELPGPGGRPIPVPKPEHLMAMKVQAMKDAPERALQDLIDIGYLLRVDGVDRDEVHGYFVRAGLEGRWNGAHPCTLTRTRSTWHVMFRRRGRTWRPCGGCDGRGRRGSH